MKEQQKRSSVLIIYTGGTIGMKQHPETKSLIPMKFEHIQEEIPEITRLGHDLSTISFDPPIDSSNIDPETWIQLAKTVKENYDKYDGFVILHGTDTMSYTASALSFMLENLDKPVICTGSQLPIGILRTDGVENLITAVEIAAAKENGRSIVTEVCVYFSSRLFRGNRTTKEDSEQFSAFESHNYPRLAKAGVDIVYRRDLMLRNNVNGSFAINTNFNKHVVVLTMFPGMTREVFESVLAIPTIQGVILRTYGSGNMPTYRWMLDAIRDASEHGIVFLNVTQCSGGRVMMGHYETSRELLEAGVVSGFDITLEAAITKMMFLLGQDLHTSEVKEMLNYSLYGEITK